uniref:At1g61320/AtMIF1 LRR domain-containing protein n=1 Tax=Setaria italica TaxID=4555 RepID=K3Y256_SETIT
DTLYHIHTLMSMRDAARAAGISRQFRQSWKFYRRLIFDIEALGINEDGPVDEVTSDFIRIIDHIMQNHSGIGVKTFRLRAVDCYNVQPSYVDRWLQCAITPGIEDFELLMPWLNKLEYNFPSSLLSTERGSSMKSFALSDCTFHSAAGVGCLSNLREVRLYSVHITGEDLLSCYDIVRLKIPCMLSQLKLLQVQDCGMLEIIESSAPNLFLFNYVGRPIHISLGHPTQLRHIEMLSLHDSNMLYSASAKLPSIAPNLQTLFLTSNSEIANTPMVHGKFIHLKYLEIALIKPSSSPDYDFYSLDSFLDGSPALDTFTLRLPAIRHDSILECSDSNSLHPRRLSEHSHDSLKNVKITGFCSAKSMIELAKHILERAPSLEHITLDTSRGRDDKSGNCAQMLQEELVEARRARLAIGRHLEEHVPSTVSLKVVESCSTCVY